MLIKSTLLHSFTVTLSNGPSVLQQALAFKAYEIEELADVYFFRPLGAIIAHTARWVGLTPTHLTILGGASGVVGGALLYDARLGLLAFALLILHGIFDSSDGQLARLTGHSTEFGRLLDGLSGYATYAAVYTAIVAGVIRDGGSPLIILWAVLAAFANAAHAQMYDYHRTSYATIAIKGLAPCGADRPVGPAWANWIPATLPCDRTKRTMRASGSTCASDQKPKSSGLMRPTGEMAAASVKTSPAPPTARLPRCTKCHSLASPSTQEYSHMGDTAIRLGNVTLRKVRGSNK